MAGGTRPARWGIGVLAVGLVTLWVDAIVAGAPPAARTLSAPTRSGTTANGSPVAGGLGAAERAPVASLQGVQRIALHYHTPDSVTTSLAIPGRTWTIDLVRHSVRAEDFRVFVQSRSDGPLVPVVPPPVRTFRGTVRQRPGSRVSAWISDGRLTARVMTRDGEYLVEPMAGDVDVNPRYAVLQVDPSARALPRVLGRLDADGASASGVVGTIASSTSVPQIADLAIDTDVEFFQDHGGSVEATVLAVDALVDAMDNVFRPATGISYELTAVVVRTAEPDPYSGLDAVPLLCQFQFEWNNGTKLFVRRDVAHLLTGRVLSGALQNASFLRSICNMAGSSPCGPTANTSYSLSESRSVTPFNTRVARTTRELGRSWGATFCDIEGSSCHIMCSTLGGCGGVDGANLTFGTRAVGEINAFRDTLACLTQRPSVQALPFSDTFPTATLDPFKWIYNVGGLVVTTGVGEPSEPNALLLSASGPDEFRDHEVRSNVIRIANEPDQILEYFTQHRGVGTGESLIVEYWSSELIWRTLRTLTSDGVDQTTFQRNSEVLPPTAKHDGFRIRFRTQVDSPGDQWFIDDVRLVDRCTVAADCSDGLFCNGVEVCQAGVCQPGGNPCLPGATCDEVNDACAAACTTAPACNDGVFCNGVEVCFGGFCGSGTPPCTAPDVCDEAGNRCVRCLVDADCSDGSFCNGVELCLGNLCFPGSTTPCTGGLSCDEVLDHCFSGTCLAPLVQREGARYFGVTPAAGVDPVGINAAPLCDVTRVQHVAAPIGGNGFARASTDASLGVFLTPADWGPTVHVSGVDVVPSAGYSVWINCGTLAAPLFSQAVNVTTERWGDVAGPFQNGMWTPPDGSVDVTADVLAIIDRFQGFPVAPPAYRADLAGGVECYPNKIIDIADIVAALDAFRGLSYASSTSCPVPCAGAD